jgi:hypothetical protein
MRFSRYVKKVLPGTGPDRLITSVWIVHGGRRMRWVAPLLPVRAGRGSARDDHMGEAATTIRDTLQYGAGYKTRSLRGSRAEPGRSRGNRQHGSGRDFLRWQVCMHRGEPACLLDSQPVQKCEGFYLWDFPEILFKALPGCGRRGLQFPAHITRFFSPAGFIVPSSRRSATMAGS